MGVSGAWLCETGAFCDCVCYNYVKEVGNYMKHVCCMIMCSNSVKEVSMIMWKKWVWLCERSELYDYVTEVSSTVMWKNRALWLCKRSDPQALILVRTCALSLIRNRSCIHPELLSGLCPIVNGVNMLVADLHWAVYSLDSNYSNISTEVYRLIIRWVYVAVLHISLFVK
jgi:hypothetical protein